MVRLLDAAERQVEQLATQDTDAPGSGTIPHPDLGPLDARQWLGFGAIHVRHHLGIVDRVFREDGYGFILTDDGEQVYFHRNAVKEGLAFDRLEEADRVALNMEPGREGPQATAVFAPPPGEG